MVVYIYVTYQQKSTVPYPKRHRYSYQVLVATTVYRNHRAYEDDHPENFAPPTQFFRLSRKLPKHLWSESPLKPVKKWTYCCWCDSDGSDGGYNQMYEFYLTYCFRLYLFAVAQLALTIWCQGWSHKIHASLIKLTVEIIIGLNENGQTGKV